MMKKMPTFIVHASLLAIVEKKSVDIAVIQIAEAAKKKREWIDY